MKALSNLTILTVGIFAAAIVSCSSSLKDTNAFKLGGIVTGLTSGTVMLQNGDQKVAVAADGTFVFPNLIDHDAAYNVTVAEQPAQQDCTVANGTGTVDQADVDSVRVTCMASSKRFTVGGSVSGLTGTLVLQNNNGDDLTVTADGAFIFATELTDGMAYAVTVKTQPTSKTCSLASSIGNISGANVTNVTVVCATNTYAVGGNVTGLSGTLVLQNNSGDDLTITANGAFTFSTNVAEGASYAVTVKTQPTGASCSLASATGTVGAAVVSNVAVACAPNTYTIGGNVTGLSGTVVLQNNGGDNKTITTNSTFNFDTAMVPDSDYAVTVLSQPTNQICVVTNGVGTVVANVTNVAVTCTSTYKVRVSVSGIGGNTAVLRNNGGDNLTVDDDLVFEFSTRVSNGVGYAVTVFTQPGTRYCKPGNNAVGTIAGADVTVALECIPKQRIFVTSANPVNQYHGNLGGISGADTICHNLAATRSEFGLLARALIVGVERTACTVPNCGVGSTSLNWPLQPNTAYVRSDPEVLIGITNAEGIFTFPLSAANSFGAAVYTGLNADWTTSANTCMNWTSNSSSNPGNYGNVGTTNAGFISTGNTPCNNVLSLICVQW